MLDFTSNKSIAIISSFFLIFVVIVPYYGFRFFRRQSKRSSVNISDKLSLTVGHASATGKRPTMEDDVLLALDISPEYAVYEAACHSRVSAFGVFDGHCGSEIAKHAAQNYRKFIQAQVQVFNPTPAQTCEGIKQSFLDFDSSTKRIPAGSTACVAFITPQHELFVANAGDSRAILIENNHPVSMSIDHKPSRESEKQRLLKAGAEVRPTTVVQSGCVLQLGPARIWPGGLSVSRGFGDHGMKDEVKMALGGFVQSQNLSWAEKQLVSPFPEIRYTELTQQSQAVILACDGLFDVMTNSDVVKIFNQQLPRLMIKAIEQVAIRNIEKSESEEQQGIIKKFIHGMQRSYARLKFSFLHELDDYKLTDELLLQADFLCAQMLSDKLVSLALQRETTDNVTVVVGLLRWKDTRKTARQWRELMKDEGLFSQFKKLLHKQNEVSCSETEDIQKDVQLWISPDDPSKQWIY
ncbi:Ser/Thr_phosphatase 2C [Hexamita inflata]|uniref:Putative n=1 Tax=Hexamita inflata TaxID=28002 RepID=A0AA86R4R0_9EUKA|nr:Ser/Thr phosphatase 2C [Hexamita inflata]